MTIINELEELKQAQSNTKEHSLKGLVSTGGHVDAMQVVLFLIFIGWFIFGLIAIYWMVVDDNPPAEIFDVQLLDSNGEPVDSIVVFPGDKLSFSLDWCKYTTASETVRTTWVNEFIDNQVPIEPGYVSPGCYTNLVSRIVPKTIRQGSTYQMHVSIFFPVNPLIERHVEFMIGDIIVLEGEEK